MLKAAIDPALRRVTITIRGDVSGTELIRTKLAIARDQAAQGIFDYDYVYQLLEYEGRLTHDDIGELARGWAEIVRGRDAGAASVLVSTDPGFRIWAGLFPVQFPGRRFRVVENETEVDAAIADIRHGGAAQGHAA